MKETDMPKKLTCLALLTLSATIAHADPFAQGDAKIGKQMVDKNCIACHAASFGGDGSGIYTREDRKIKNAKGLVRIEALLSKCGFRSQGLFVMDGSRRSSHGNAYFTGFGAAKRVVFFDTRYVLLRSRQACSGRPRAWRAAAVCRAVADERRG